MPAGTKPVPPKNNEIDRSGLTYVALKRMQIGASWREIGQAVPEAAGWRNVHNYISQGFLAVTGGALAHPGVRANQPGRPVGATRTQGNEFASYQPTDHTGAQSKPPIDAA